MVSKTLLCHLPPGIVQTLVAPGGPHCPCQPPCCPISSPCVSPHPFPLQLLLPPWAPPLPEALRPQSQKVPAGIQHHPGGPSRGGTRAWSASKGNDHDYKIMTGRLSDLLLNGMRHLWGGKLHTGWALVQLEEVTELGRPVARLTINSASKSGCTLSAS